MSADNTRGTLYLRLRPGETFDIVTEHGPVTVRLRDRPGRGAAMLSVVADRRIRITRDGGPPVNRRRNSSPEANPAS